MRQNLKHLFFLLLGLLIGFSFYYLKTLCTFKEGIVYKDDIANVTVETKENLGFKVITISGGRLPLIKMELNKMERKIEKAALYDAQNRIIGLLYVSEKSFNGIEILNSENIPFFQMEYNPNEKRWQFGCYFKQTKDDKLISDVNKDINLDGQFDILFIFDEFGNAQAEAVYFNGSWNPAVISDDSLSAKVTIIDEKENIDIDMIFNFDKGWIPAP